jgi:hypothetical protein
MVSVAGQPEDLGHMGSAFPGTEWQCLQTNCKCWGGLCGSNSPADDMKLRQHHAHCEAESSDMLLYLAGINEHAVLRIVGSKRWSAAQFLRTIQYLFEYGVRFLTT